MSTAPKSLKTTGDLRTLLANIALDVVRGDVKVQEAAIAVKACKEINSSLYSEIKAAAMLAELTPGATQTALGDLPLAGARA